MLNILFRTYAEYVTPSVLLAEQLHCTIEDLNCFRRASFQDIIRAQQVVNGMFTSFQFLFFFEPWVPVIDHQLIQGQLLEIVHNTSFNLKPLILGTVTEEGYGFIFSGDGKPLSSVEYI